MRLKVVTLLIGLVLGACGSKTEPAQSVNDSGGENSSASPSNNDVASTPSQAAPSRTQQGLLTIPNDIFSALPAKNATRTAFFGDLHVHTTYSLDAFAVGTMATPSDAYRYALGDTIQHPAGFDMTLRVPLDF